jgi:protein-L-isoaspartate(D-aspartate) O-methyltransferase
MVQRLVKEGYVRTPAVASALRSVPRHCFLPRDRQGLAYVDSPIDIGEGQTISAPHMVAMMLERLELAPGHKVLEVGGGSGYHAACVAHLVRPGGTVCSVEYVPALAERSRGNLAAAEVPEGEVSVVAGDGSLGLEAASPFDRIFLSCAAPEVPPPLLKQLRAPGILLAPVGSRHLQSLVRVVKDTEGRLHREDHGGCIFVPLMGRYGFDPRD